MLAVVLGFSAAKADVVSPYTYDFSGLEEGKLVTSFNPPGWGRVVDKFEPNSWSTPQFVAYYGKVDGGHGDNGACLQVGTQHLTESYGDGEKYCKDMIVSPAVTGNASIYVKPTYAGGTVTFYYCTPADGTFTAGDQIEVTLPELSTTEWTKVELPSLPAGTYVGVCGDNVLLDDFTADSADVVLKKSMIVLSSPTMVSGGELDADENGIAYVHFKAKVKNNGETPLAVGDEGFSISLYDNSAEVAVGDPIAITSPLGINETLEVEATVPVTVTENYRHGFHVKENISGSTTYLGWIEFFPHTPSFAMEDDLGHDVNNGDVADFQIMQTNASKVFVINNRKGGAPLTISSVSVPDGFTYSLSASQGGAAVEMPYAIAAHAKAYLTVTMDAATVGKRTGYIVITSAEAGDFTMPVAGEIIDASKVYINFNDQKFPAGTYIELSSGQKRWVVENFSYSENGYAAFNKEVEPMTKFVLPKIHLEEGEHMTFDANKANSTSKLNVYYSADRKNWTKVKEITIDNTDDANCFATGTYPSGYYDNYLFKTFTLDQIPAGDWYIAFEAGYARVDNIIGGTYLETPDYEIEIGNVNIPKTATVNHASTVSLNISSFGKKDIEEGTLRAKFYIGDDVVAETDLPAIATGEYTRAEFSFTPRKAGDFTAKVVVEGGAQAESTSDISVAAEQSIGAFVVGNKSTTANDSPFQLNYYNSQAEIVYTADMLSGIAPGTAIKSISFSGYKNGNKKQIINTQLTIKMENTEDSAPTTSSWYTSDAMTTVFDDTYLIADVIGTSENHQPVINVTFATPFVYTGGNLRVTLQSSASQYETAYFDVDSSISGQTAMRYSDNTPSGLLTLKSLPVTTFGFDKEASVFSGVVTAEADGSAIADADVLLVSDNVEYSGTTDAEGNFSFIVYQDGLNYNLTVSKAGFFADREEVNLNGASLAKNVALKAAQGFNLLKAEVPATAEVNSTYTATVRVENGEAKEANSYRAELWVNDVVVDLAEAPALEASKEYDFTFAYVPHSEGNANTVVKFFSETGNAESEAVDVAVAAEKGNAEIIVGNKTGTVSAGPVEFFYKKSKTEIIYPKALINLPAGSQINEIQFFGSHISKGFAFNVNAWMGNVPEGTALSGVEPNGLPPVADNLQVDMSQAITADNLSSALTLTFPDGFIYDGGDIRLVTSAEGTNYNQTYFEVDNTVTGQAQQIKDDNSLDGKTPSAISLPVAHFIISPYKTLSGSVNNEAGEAVEGAHLTLTSEDGVEYYATSDAEGAFSMQVIKYNNDYTLTVRHLNYDDYTYAETVSLADGDIDGMAITLEKTYTFSGVVTDAETHEAIEGAEVIMSNPESGAEYALTTTDENGEFEICFKDLGTYNVLVKAEGYDMFSQEEVPFEDSLNGNIIELNQTVYTFSGIVGDAATFAPIAGAEVIMTDLESGAEYASATTDENGAFAIQFKDLDTYNVLVKADGYDMFSQEEVPFEGSMVDMEIYLNKTVYTFSGFVSDAATFAPIAGAEVIMTDLESGAEYASATTDENGAFAIQFSQLGTYNVLVKAEGYDMFSQEEVPFEGSMVDLEINLNKTVYTFSGFVSDAVTFAPIAGAEVVMTDLVSGAVFASATTDESGAFAIQFSQLGTYNVTVTADGYETFSQEEVPFEGNMVDMEIDLNKLSSVGLLTADGLRVYGTTGAVVVESPADATVRIYNAAGSLLRSAEVGAGKTRVDGLNRGIYVVNGVKVIVK